MNEVWDKEIIYDEEVSPLVSKLIELACKHDMPMLFSMVYSVDEDGGSNHCTTYIPRKNGDEPEELAKARDIIYRKPSSFTTIISKEKAVD